MRTLRIAAAFIAGVWLYYVAVVFTGGVLAAVGVPRGYFAFFGREHNELALAVLFFLGWALPVAVLVTGGTLALSRLIAGNGQRVWKPALAGMLLGFLYWALVSAGFFSPQEEAQVGLVQALQLTFTIPWWAAANFLAPWLGFAVAAWLMYRAKR